MNVITVHEAILNDFWKKVPKIHKILKWMIFYQFYLYNHDKTLANFLIHIVELRCKKYPIRRKPTNTYWIHRIKVTIDQCWALLRMKFMIIIFPEVLPIFQLCRYQETWIFSSSKSIICKSEWIISLCFQLKGSCKVY